MGFGSNSSESLNYYAMLWTTVLRVNFWVYVRFPSNPCYKSMRKKVQNNNCCKFFRVRQEIESNFLVKKIQSWLEEFFNFSNNHLKYNNFSSC